MRPHHRAVEHLDQMRAVAVLRKQLKERLEDAALAQPPEPFPDAVPVPELLGNGSPGDVVDREIMQRLQKFAVVPPLVPVPRARRPEKLYRKRPFLIRHPRQHGRLPNQPTSYESRSKPNRNHQSANRFNLSQIRPHDLTRLT